jgi:hypothetical protein
MNAHRSVNSKLIQAVCVDSSWPIRRGGLRASANPRDGREISQRFLCQHQRVRGEFRVHALDTIAVWSVNRRPATGLTHGGRRLARARDAAPLGGRFQKQEGVQPRRLAPFNRRSLSGGSDRALNGGRNGRHGKELVWDRCRDTIMDAGWPALVLHVGNVEYTKNSAESEKAS